MKLQSLLAAIAMPLVFAGCTSDGMGEDVDRGLVDGKADNLTGTCSIDDCGSWASNGSGWCDDICVDYGDCAEGVGSVCGFNECNDNDGCRDGDECIEGADYFECITPEPEFCANGTVVKETYYIASADDMECAMPRLHCVTNDWDACPQWTPYPPDYCDDGTVVSGPSSFITSSDGMECEIPSIHCLTNDLDACPLFSLPPPDYCEDGTVVSGDSSFINVGDNKECEIPSIHCLSNDLDACPLF